jgi:hypothetical protein
MNDLLEDHLLNALSGMTAGPRPLVEAIRFYAQQEHDTPVKIERDLQKRVMQGANDEVRKLFNQYLGRWDWEANAPWTDGTKPNTPDRRDRIYELLRIDKPLRATLDEQTPPFVGAKAVIIDDPASVRDWYTLNFRRKHNFYWKALRTFLETTRKFESDAINSLDASADRIIERLGDPAGSEVYNARGLVVGYVQSGKTTNFTAVIAKAIDAGYRLIIVLSGTTNLLRNQTQRRLDMELVGVENILRGASGEDVDHDYIEDDAWPEKFISYGKQPSLMGHVDIHRLTSQVDFKRRDAGLNPLEFEFEKRDRHLPLYNRENLDHAGARLVVVKKQGDRLRGLKEELTHVGRAKSADVPTLIIDDESDQASVNTVNPNPPRKPVVDLTRSRINNYIVDILKLLPRAQYLGYTATPFANVFVNPNDPADIYPKDVIISLPRPVGYMGAAEFLDFAAPKPGRLSNEEACIRNIPKNDKVPMDYRLREALDAFVLTGALKKFRQEHTGITFKHHTMLFHHSVKKDDQVDVVRDIRALWKDAGYDSSSSSAGRLEELLEKDFRKVWLDRGKPAGLPFPKKYGDLVPFLGAALDEMRRGKSPVLMVNSAEGAEVPDFDGKVGVWKIIVGGAKLSRGYTIEGLTISYFRRASKMQDTLMQMGRWFGYRLGYADFVRLYIGRMEVMGKNTIDLYRAFDAMCRDEEDFRAQLAMYEGKGGITPREVPALVFNSHPRLRPTSLNKMFHAKITWAAFDYREPTSQAASNAGRKSNVALFEKFISKMEIATSKVGWGGSRSKGFDVKWATLSHIDAVSILKRVKWETECPIEAEIEFLSRKLAPVDSWLFLAPQIAEGEALPWRVGAEQFQCVARKRMERSDRFGVYSSPQHLDFAKSLVGGLEKGFVSTLKPRKRTAILLFYPTRELLPEGKVSGGNPVMGFGILLPNIDGQAQRIAYSV